MPYVRNNTRLCGYDIVRHSSLKKAGLLYKQFCFRCNAMCWIYVGNNFRYLHAIEVTTS